VSGAPSVQAIDMPRTPSPIIRPFPEDVLRTLRQLTQVLRGRYSSEPLHALNCNRWQEHNNPMLRTLHRRQSLIETAAAFFGEPVMPSYVFLSMYSSQGVCPPHRDRPQCQYTVNLCIRQDKPWPIYIENAGDGSFEEVILGEGDAVMFSGTEQTHYRKPMPENGGTYCDVAHFHLVPVGFSGPLT
jgi:hypothetical protein